MATLNFPNPGSTETYTEAGITWTWNSTLGAWSSEAADGGGAPITADYTYPGSNVTRQVYERLTDYVSVKDFGAVGDGVADDTDAIENALNNGGEIFFPAGTYKMTRPVVLDNNSVHLRGTGEQSKILASPSGNVSTPWFHFKYSDAGQYGSTYALSEIQLECDRGVTIECGVRLEYTGNSGVVGEWDSMHLNGVEISTNFPANGVGGYFKKGFHILNAGGVKATNLSITPGMTDVEDDTDTIGVLIENTKAGHFMIKTFMVVNFYCSRHNRAMLVRKTEGNSNIESCYISQAEILGNTGIVFENVHATSITGSHFDCKGMSLDISSDGGPHRVVGNDIRSNRIGQSFDNYLVRLGCSNIVFANNYVEAFSPTRGAIVVENNLNGLDIKNIIISTNSIRGNPAHNSKALTVNRGENVQFSNNELYEWVGGDASWQDNTGNLIISDQQVQSTLYSNEGLLNNTLSLLPGTDNTNTGCHIEAAGDGSTLHISRTNNVPASFNRNTDGSLLAFRHMGNTVGTMGITGTKITLTGLAGGPLLRDGVDLNSSEGIILALSNALERIEQLEELNNGT